MDGQDSEIGSSTGHGHGVTMSEIGHVRTSGEAHNISPRHYLHPSSPQSSYDPYAEAARLDMARKAMMCVREIVRTERSYLAHLRNAGEREVCWIVHHGKSCLITILVHVAFFPLTSVLMILEFEY